jgi:UDP-glucose 4-epimerase
MKILVTGAAGYIGSVVTECLLAEGHQVVALDNLQSGHIRAVHPDARFIQLDLLNRDAVAELFRREELDAVVHLAAEALIDESVRDPGRFFRANVTGGLNLVDAMIAHGVLQLIFSSTAAVYGEPNAVPITEETPERPVNAYGESKLVFERILAWYRRAHGLRFIILRYFNACGATELFGENRVRETHLIPILLEAAAGERAVVNIYGADYDTPDGTCVRDYVHVVDIARAHLLGLAKLNVLEERAYNLGNGNGHSNREVIAAVERVTGRRLKINLAPRRVGEPARLVASSERIRRDFGWEPRYPDLATMIGTAWEWRQRCSRGYQT